MKSKLILCINYALSKEIPNISKFLLSIFIKLRSAEGEHPRYKWRKAFLEKMQIWAKIWFRAKTIVTSLPRDIHSDLKKIDIILWFSLYVIHVL